MRCERWESRAHNGFRLAGSDEDGGNPANIAASGASNQTQRDARAVQENALRASGIARRRTEGKRAEVFFLCATTTAADSKRPGSRAAVLDERTSRHAFRL
jgi:hypothetical protein